MAWDDRYLAVRNIMLVAGWCRNFDGRTQAENENLWGDCRPCGELPADLESTANDEELWLSVGFQPKADSDEGKSLKRLRDWQPTWCEYCRQVKPYRETIADAKRRARNARHRLKKWARRLADEEGIDWPLAGKHLRDYLESAWRKGIAPPRPKP